MQSNVCALKFLTKIRRVSNGDPKELENHFKNILLKREITNKELVLVGDFNINVFEFNESKMVQNFVDLMFRHDLIPTK